MANLKRSQAPQIKATQAAGDPQELVRQSEFQAALALKANANAAWPYQSIYNFDSGVQATMASYLGDSWSVQWSTESGINYAQVRLAAEGGLEASDAGVQVKFGVGYGDVARGNHSHDQLHDAVTLGSGETVQLFLNGQQLRAELRTTGSGWQATSSGIALVFGTTPGTVADGAHTHAGLEQAHAALTKQDSQTIQLVLSAQQLTANLRMQGPGWQVSDSGVRLDIGTGSAQLAAGNHSHAQLHDALTKQDGKSVVFTLAGQQISAEVRLLTQSGLYYEDSGLALLLKEGGGLRKGEYGVEVDSGIYSLTTHTHAQLHDPFTVDPSQSIAFTLAGQKLSAEVRVQDNGGLQVTDSGLRVEPNRYAPFNHTHSEFHAPVTTANTSSVTFTLSGQEISAAVKLDASPSAGRGLVGVTNAGLYIPLGESGNMAAAGNHEHQEATEVLPGFLSASDKYKLNRLSALTPQDTPTVLLAFESGILRADVQYGPGLTVGDSGLEIDPWLTDTTTVRLQFQNHRLSAAIKYGPGLVIGDSGLQVDDSYLSSRSVQLEDTAPPVLVVGQTPVVGDSTKAMRGNAKPGLPGLATSEAHGFMDKADKARFDLSHIGNFNGQVNAVMVDRDAETVYVVGDFTKAGNAAANRIAAVQFNGMIDKRFAPGTGFAVAPEQIIRHTSGDLLVGGTTAKLSYRGGTAAWIHKLSKLGTPDAGFTSPGAIAAAGSDSLLSMAVLDNGRIAVNSWQTFRLLTATGSTVVTKNGDINFHYVTSEGNNAYLMTRRDSDYAGVSNPRAIKKIDGSLDTGAVVSAWSTFAGSGGEANASYAVMAPDKTFFIAANSIASANGGGTSYAWNGNSPTRHRGLYKIRPNGTEDTGWSINIVMNGAAWVKPLAIDTLGRVYFTGDIASINGTAVTANQLYRVDATGGDLAVFGAFNGNVTDAKLINDDYLVVVGAFTQYGDLPVGRFLFMDSLGRALPFIPTCKPTKYQAYTLAGAGAPLTLTMPYGKRFLAAEFTVTGTPYVAVTRKIILDRKNVDEGAHADMHFDMPADPNVTIEIYDNEISDVPLVAFAGKTTAIPLWLLFVYSGSEWRSFGLSYLTDVPFSVGALPPPVFTPATGATDPATVSIAVPGYGSAAIYYTTDGSTPTTNSAVYEGPIDMGEFETDTTHGITLKAMAVLENYGQSPVAVASYTLTAKLPLPVFTPGSGAVTPVSVEIEVPGHPDAEIHYTTNGSTPTAGSTLYTEAIDLTTTTTLKAMAVETSYRESDVAAATYAPASSGQLPTPVFTPTTGTQVFPVSVSITVPGHTSGMIIYYTTDGSAPDIDSPRYEGVPIVLDGATAATIKAFATKATYSPSEVATKVYTKATLAAPTFTPNGGSVLVGDTVVLSHAIAGVEFRYTTDGSVPDESSTLYAGPIELTALPTTVKAIAIKSGYQNSAAGSAAFTQPQVATPTFSPTPGTVALPVNVSMACATSGADIHYTTDGSTPTAGSTLYTGPVTLAADTTVKAIAILSGYLDSAVASGLYSNDLIAPVIAPANGSVIPDQTAVTLSQSGNPVGTQIYYTIDGSTPDNTKVLYTVPFTINANMTVKAVCVKAGYSDSAVVSASYTKATAPTPTATPSAGQIKNASISVTLASTLAGSQIRYTTNGTTPDGSSTLYTAPITVNQNVTVKAKTFKAGYNTSALLTAAYPKAVVPTPVLNPANGGIPFVNPNLSISVANVVCLDGTFVPTIYYTTDGSDPAVTGTGPFTPVGTTVEYGGPIYINAATVKAIACFTNCTTSAIASGTFYQATVATPVANPASGAVAFPRNIVLTCATPGAAMRYTTDGSTPDGFSPVYFNGAISVNAGMTVKAFAKLTGMIDSAVMTEVYTQAQLVTTLSPVPPTGASQVTIASSVAGSTIYYTLDGSDPDTGSFVYTGAPIAISGTTVVKAFAKKTGYLDSSIVSGTYN